MQCSYALGGNRVDGVKNNVVKEERFHNVELLDDECGNFLFQTSRLSDSSHCRLFAHVSADAQNISLGRNFRHT